MTGSARPGELRIAAVVLNYRTPELVIDCLKTLAPELDPRLDRIFVVDNASGDHSVESIRRAVETARWQHVEVVESPTNGGFGAGNNLGIQQVTARAYLLLNSDTLVRPGAPQALWAALEQSDIGIVSPRLESPAGEQQVSCFRFHSPLGELIRGARTGAIRRLLARWDVPLDVDDGPSEPEWTSFAAVLLRREVIERVGLLDEGFFMYFEDVDYCWRARQLGFRIVNEPRARVVHLVSGTSQVEMLQRARSRRPRYYYESRARYFRKVYGRAGPFLANVCWTLGRGIARSRELVGNKSPHTVAFELVDNWRC